MININVLLTEQDMAASFLTELNDNNLPERFFYWFPLSVRAWLNLCSDGAYKNFLRSYGLIEENAADIAAHLAQRELSSNELEVISLGAGQADKDIIILNALAALNHSFHYRYRPVDASQALLEIACSTATRLGFSCQGVKANITDPAHLSSIFSPKTSTGTRLVLLLGNTLGAFDPATYIKTLKNLLNPGDFLLVDGEFYAAGQTVAGYDNVLNRQFAFAPLQSMGITATDGELYFQTHEDKSLPGLYRLTKHFLPQRDFNIQVAGQTVSFKKDVKLKMSYSGKYAQSTFFRVIDEIGEFQRKAEYITADKRFTMVLATLQ